MKVRKNRETEVRRTRNSSSESVERNRNSFRRGKNLSGYKKEESDRAKRHDLVVQRRKFGGFFVFIIFSAIIILFFLLQVTLKADIYSSGGQKIEDQQKYSNALQRYYEDHPIERLRLFLNGDNLLKELQTELPEISKIENIRSNGFTKTDFVFVMRKPVANWSVDSDRNYFVDNTGMAFEKNYFDPPKVSVSDESGVKIKDGNIVVSNSFLSFIGRTIGSAETNNITIERIVIPPASLRQIEIYVSGQDFPIKFITSREPEKQVQDLSSALTFLSSKGINPQYLDLRVKGKAYYK